MLMLRIMKTFVLRKQKQSNLLDVTHLRTNRLDSDLRLLFVLDIFLRQESVSPVFDLKDLYK